MLKENRKIVLILMTFLHSGQGGFRKAETEGTRNQRTRTGWPDIRSA